MVATEDRGGFDAYGEAQILTPLYVTRGTSLYGNPYLFTGRRLDRIDSGSLKLQYSRHRYYDYETGRWLTRDPQGVTPCAHKNPFNIHGQYEDGVNLYQYIYSNPTRDLDPFGLAVQVWYKCIIKSEKKQRCRRICTYFCVEDKTKKRKFILQTIPPFDVDDPRIPSVTEMRRNKFRWGKCKKYRNHVEVYANLPNWPTNCSVEKCEKEAKEWKKAAKISCKLYLLPKVRAACKVGVELTYEGMLAGCQMCDNP